MTDIPPVHAVEFRALMSTFPTGVAVVTSVDASGRPWGMTCSSVCSVSLDPPTLLVCLRRGSPTLNATLGVEAFAVNLLHDRARAVAELFASGDPDRFDRVPWRGQLPAGCPHLVRDAHAIADCRLTRSISIGDHVVLFGEVFRVEREAHRQPAPLLHGLRQYASWRAGAAVHLPVPRIVDQPMRNTT
jgi:flavin reductase (DIM6/NTAB) family NADH-FMN oxidoreductase RutF